MIFQIWSSHIPITYNLGLGRAMNESEFPIKNHWNAFLYITFLLTNVLHIYGTIIFIKPFISFFSAIIFTINILFFKCILSSFTLLLSEIFTYFTSCEFNTYQTIAGTVAPLSTYVDLYFSWNVKNGWAEAFQTLR